MTKTYFAPGRVNLMGDHIDYNGGLVLPAALTIGITAKFKKRTDDKILLRSATHQFTNQISINDTISFEAKNEWTNYPLGIIKHLREADHSIAPCEITYESNMPEASALSSSAAIEVLTAYILLEQQGTDIDRTWLSEFCQRVENEFIGVKCGIMDQFSVAQGKAENAILLNCANLSFQYVPLYLDEYRLLILNTCKPRSLIHSKYNERKEQSMKALEIIKGKFPISNLCDADYTHLDLLDDEVIKRRAKHVITENLRVKETVKALRLNDLSTFGRLMNASHTSLKNDYEVSGLELDTLVAEAQQIKGCLGARMTGGGFAGCAIALVHKNAVAALTEQVSAKYLATTGLKCEIYESEIGDGVREI